MTPARGQEVAHLKVALRIPSPIETLAAHRNPTIFEGVPHSAVAQLMDPKNIENLDGDMYMPEIDDDGMDSSDILPKNLLGEKALEETGECAEAKEQDIDPEQAKMLQECLQDM